MSNRAIYIVTGGSRGLGLAVIKQLLSEGKGPVFCLSRNRPKISNEENKSVHFFPTDFSNISQVEKTIGMLEIYLAKDPPQEVVFVHAAAQIMPMNLMGKIAPGNILSSINVNLTGPLYLINFLVGKVKKSFDHLTIVNVSSGLTQNPAKGGALYCMGKSGMEVVIEVMKKEWEGLEGLTICNFLPGLIDTQMQREIRNQTEETFPEVQKFRELHNRGALKSPQTVAAQLINQAQI